jgi:hypothetical protein
VGGLALAVHCWLRINAAAVTSSGQTGGFTEVADVGTTIAGTVNNISLAVSTQQVAADGTFASTATASATAKPAHIVIVYKPKVVGGGGEEEPPPEPGVFTHGDQITTSNVGLLGSGEVTNETLGATTYDTAFNGQTITHKHYTGRVTVTGNNVTFRYCQFDAGITNLEGANRRFTVEDSDIGPPTGTYIFDNGVVGMIDFTLRRCRIRNCNEGARCQGSVLVEDTIVYSMNGEADDHSDCFQIYGAQGGVSGGTGLVFRRVNADCRWDAWTPAEPFDSKNWGNGTMQMGDGPTNMQITIEDSLLAGGYVCMRLEDAKASTNLSYIVRNVKIVRGSVRGAPCAITGSEQGQITWSNVTWSDNGQAIPKPT